jgi:hypothetical protein
MGIAAALSAAPLALSAFGSITEAQGKAAGYRQAEDKAQRQAMAARTAADQTDTALREELATTLGNIASIRAAANIDPTSPTGLAIAEEERRQSERQRLIRTGNLRAQATQSDRDASFNRYAASNAMTSGYINAFSQGIKGLSGLGR